MLWCLVHQGVLPLEAAHDPWGPRLDASEFESLGECLKRLDRGGWRTPGSRSHDRHPASSSAPDARRCPGPCEQGRSGPRPVRAQGLPEDLDAYLRAAYNLDMTASYAGIPLRNPWGKASGQLTLNLAQLEEAAAERTGLRGPQDRDRPGCLGPAVDGRLGDQGIADGRRAHRQPRHRRARLDDHLARERMVAVV